MVREMCLRGGPRRKHSWRSNWERDAAGGQVEEGREAAGARGRAAIGAAEATEATARTVVAPAPEHDTAIAAATREG
ncbi:unnamed protein product [Closterium sp. NIES-54]